MALTEWNRAVQTAFKAGRRTNKFYSLKSAMFDAKKIYKKGATVTDSVLNTTRSAILGNKRRNGRRTRKGKRRGTRKGRK